MTYFCDFCGDEISPDRAFECGICPKCEDQENQRALYEAELEGEDADREERF